MNGNLPSMMIQATNLVLGLLYLEGSITGPYRGVIVLL